MAPFFKSSELGGKPLICQIEPRPQVHMSSLHHDIWNIAITDVQRILTAQISASSHHTHDAQQTLKYQHRQMQPLATIISDILLGL